MKKGRLHSEVASHYRNRVRQCRLRAMVPKQEDLARMTGINRNTINALENQRIFLSSHYALVISEALSCSMDDLFEKREAKLLLPLDVFRKASVEEASKSL